MITRHHAADALLEWNAFGFRCFVCNYRQRLIYLPGIQGLPSNLCHACLQCHLNIAEALVVPLEALCVSH